MSAVFALLAVLLIAQAARPRVQKWLRRLRRRRSSRRQDWVTASFPVLALQVLMLRAGESAGVPVAAWSLVTVPALALLVLQVRNA